MPPPIAAAQPVAPEQRRSTALPRHTGYPVVPGSIAPVGRRVAAYAIDVAALVLLAVVGAAVASAVVASREGRDGFLDPAGPGGAVLVVDVLVLLGALALWVAESVTGATLGGALLGIRTVGLETGRPAGLLRILLRSVVVGLGALACGLGQWLVVASGAFDKTPAQRGWHDKAAGTLVLRASATRVARSSDPSVAWDRAVSRAVGGPTTAPAPAPVSEPVLAPAPPPDPVLGPGPVPPPGPALAPVPAPPPSPVPAPVPVLPPDLAVAPGPVPPHGSAPLTGPVTGTDQVPAPAPHPASAPTSTVGLVPLPPAGSATPVRPTTPPPGLITGFPDPAAAPVPRHFEDRDDVEHTRLRESAPDAPRPDARPSGLRLVFDTGELVDVTGDGLVGRSPDAQPGVEHLVAIDDPARSLSKVHVAFGVGGPDTLWVVDRGSTNGTVLVRPDGSRAVLPAGARAEVGVGWTIRLGERSALVERR
ncbi:hypothetical protein CCO02nite_29700 [Cellulomonas composti]|uniref:FHA domain-containing protein n=1 Tax=Cellulomonas composti TaxID=266130 RepID=A0A511JEC4_9CELL|nr:hypothetical protein CCO02nite_29700 [Cellulomonas composti]